jgi:hypothetical protein
VTALGQPFRIEIRLTTKLHDPLGDLIGMRLLLGGMLQKLLPLTARGSRSPCSSVGDT